MTALEDYAQHPVDVIAPAATGRPRRVKRWFYIGITLSMILFNVVAFGPSIFDPSNRNVPLPFTPLVMAHAIVSVAWLLMFLAQATLAATGRTGVHRRVGVIGALLTLAFIAVAYLTTIEEARRGFNLSGDGGPAARPDAALNPEATAILFNLLVFATLAGAGLRYRHRPRVHKRLMLLAMLGGLTPVPVGHLLGHWEPPEDLVGPIFLLTLLIAVSAVAIHDRISEGRIHPVSLWGMILIPVPTVFFFAVIAPMPAWRGFAAWLIQ